MRTERNTKVTRIGHPGRSHIPLTESILYSKLDLDGRRQACGMDAGDVGRHTRYDRGRGAGGHTRRFSDGSRHVGAQCDSASDPVHHANTSRTASSSSNNCPDPRSKHADGIADNTDDGSTDTFAHSIANTDHRTNCVTNTHVRCPGYDAPPIAPTIHSRTGQSNRDANRECGTTDAGQST